MIYLPHNLPAAATLRAEGRAVAGYDPDRPDSLPAGVPRVLLLNLMPEKAVTELDMARALSAGGADVALLPVRIAGQVYKTTPQAHMDAFYRDFETFEGGRYASLIVTGAPLEHLPFEQVRYWPQLCRIFAWADRHVAGTLYVCWAAQAALYHFHGVPKHALAAKKFGLFDQRVVQPSHPLMRGLAPAFPMPGSRHTEVRGTEVAATGVQLLAESAESGVGVACEGGVRRVYVTGHLEYAPDTLHREYLRDLAKGLPIAEPLHYYTEPGNPQSAIRHTWAGAARTFYANWLAGAAEAWRRQCRQPF